MQSIALVIHVALAVGLIGLVLIQHGKGADAGAAFGSGASATVFGARGSASFMTRMTTGVASAFFLTSLVLFYLAANRDRGLDSVTDLPGSVVEQPAGESDVEEPADDLPGGVSEESVDEASGGESESDLPAGPSGDTSDATADEELPAAPVADEAADGDLAAPAPDESGAPDENADDPANGQ